MVALGGFFLFFLPGDIPTSRVLASLFYFQFFRLTTLLFGFDEFAPDR